MREFRAVRKKGFIQIKTERGHFNLVEWNGKPTDFGLNNPHLPEKIKLYEIQDFMPYGTMHEDEIKERKGLGSKSLDHAINIAKNEGAHVLAITTDNPKLVRLLEKRGFQKVKDRVFVKLLLD